MTALSPTPALRDLIAPAAPWLETVRERMRAIVPPEGELLMVALDQSLGADGKLLRPLLTLLCALATLPPGSSPNEGHLETAAAAELIHIATLLHDDVLDDADLRRGRPTVRASFGNRVAILAGDYLLAQASRKLAAVGDIRVVSLFSDVLAALCDGEVEQIRASYSVSASDWDSYRRKTIGKTASLFAACCEAPAHLNGLCADNAASLRAFGEQVGIAFQIMDDLLDFTASESELGKPVMDDLRNGLLNAPALLALESSYGGDMRSAVQALFKAQGQDFDAAQSPQAIQTALADIQRVMSAAGVFDKTRALAQSRVDQAIDALGFLPPSDAKDALIALARFTLARRS